MGLTFRDLLVANFERCKRWHKGGIFDWSPSDWALATVGELGEACNAIKKLKRIDDEIANISEHADRQLSTRQEALAAIGEELADTAIYLDLLAQRLGVDLEDHIVRKFNKVSERYGFPEPKIDLEKFVAAFGKRAQRGG